MNIRLLHYNALFLLGVCFLFSCCSEDDAPFSGDTVPVSFSTDIAGNFFPDTRVTDDHWDVNDAVGIYMVNGSNTLGNNTNQLHTNGKYSVSSGGTGVSLTGLKNADGTPIEFPNTGSVNFVAYYPYSTSVNGSNFLLPVNVTTQSKPADIDVLYYKNTSKTYAKSSPTVPLSFEHQLCKLVVNVYRDVNSITTTQLNNLVVGLTGTNRQANFNLSDGTLTSLSNSGAITAYKKSTGNGTSTPSVYEIILLPHAAASGRQITFSTSGYSGGNYTISPSQPFLKGTKYTCDIMLGSSTPVLLTSGLTPWTGGGFAGNATHYIKVSESSLSAPLSAGSGTFTVITDASASTLSISRSNTTMITSCSITNTTSSGGVYTHTMTYNYSAISSDRESFITLTHGGGPSLAVSVKQSDSGGSSGGDGGSGGNSGGGSHGTHVSNCYILNPVVGNAINVPVSRANDFASGAVSGSFTARVLWWQNAGGSSVCPVTVGTSGSGNSGHIVVTSTGRRGNAVVAVVVGGSIKWSWHIWCTDTPGVVGVGNALFMDRNLGATITSPGSVSAHGLFYQWGRKDPFPGSSALAENTESTIYTSSGATTISLVSISSSGVPMTTAVADPMNFYYSNSSYDWCSSRDGTRWGYTSGKTIYDPCPVGWRVPVVGNFTRFQDLLSDWDSGARGRFDPSGQWWPAAGYRGNSYGTLGDVGDYGYYWSSTPNGDNACRLNFYSGTVNESMSSNRRGGFSVRCVAE